MPLYEYECLKCGENFEMIRKFSDPPVKSCPRCRGKVRKLISASSFAFKGKGWYVTDYARKNGTSATGKGDQKPTSDSSGEAGSSKKDKKETSASSSAGDKPRSDAK